MSIALDLSDLAELLSEAGVPATVYSLGVPLEDRWCVVPVTGADEETGRPVPVSWQVYRLSGGAKQRLTTTSTEEAACDVLLGELGFGQRSWQ
jgi:hypothetical protein